MFGIVLIGVGAWTLIKFGDYVTLTDSIPYATGSKVTIAAGCLIALISFMGCCGAWKENRCMLVIVSSDSRGYCPFYIVQYLSNDYAIAIENRIHHCHIAHTV